ncbi:multiple sugar transport system permease protein [Halobacillus dabanensis]|uniref:Multiple sugar transport system permease protein n=1 Tax=Halobacillus dabanensis TaxID=240302 RepID=A0A1I3RWR5_HALDA|nr:carbohydrate ABC transporter permease [Halobacillus dabanensis]SFJ51034.1 multiple sugar transport system permease protein [Halobacillus dabanensis]
MRNNSISAMASRSEEQHDSEIRRNQRKSFLAKIIIWILLILAAGICLLPFYSMMITATHANADITRKLLLTPGSHLIDNYQRLVDVVPIWRGFLNSLIITVSATAIGLYFSALSGYGFSKFNFKWNGPLFAFVLATMMIPGQLGIIGFFKLMNMFGLINTYWPLIVPAANNAFGLFFLKQVADSAVPKELLESGRIDGCNELQIFHRIALPLMTPAIATLGIFLFIGKWNEFLQPMIILFDNSLQPLPVMIASVRNQFSVDYGAQYVGIAISVVPIIIVFALASKKIIGNVMAGALKQ